jgi:hypothetical protein
LGCCAYRRPHDRTNVRNDLDLNTSRLERHHDVREEHGSVYAVSADRLQGDLGS